VKAVAILAKGKIEEGDEVDLRVTVQRVWPNGQITIVIKSATAESHMASSACRCRCGAS